MTRNADTGFFESPPEPLVMFKKQGDKDAPKEWLIPDFIPKNEATLLIGDVYEGYDHEALSTCATQFAISVAAGASAFGLPSGPAAPAIFISGDDRMANIHRRIQRCSGPQLAAPLHFTTCGARSSYLCVQGENGRLKPGAYYNELSKMLAQIPGALVVLDSIVSFWALREDSHSDISQFIRVYLGSLIRAYDATFLLVNPTFESPEVKYPGSPAIFDTFSTHLWLERTPKGHWLSRRKSSYPGLGIAETPITWEDRIFVPAKREAA